LSFPGGAQWYDPKISSSIQLPLNSKTSTSPPVGQHCFALGSGMSQNAGQMPLAERGGSEQLAYTRNMIAVVVVETVAVVCTYGWRDDMIYDRAQRLHRVFVVQWCSVGDVDKVNACADTALINERVQHITQAHGRTSTAEVLRTRACMAGLGSLSGLSNHAMHPPRISHT
jgi:hypothetical protein